MSKICSRCHRGPATGHSRSHSNIASKRRMMLNLQKKTIHGIQMLLCTSCIRTLKRA